MKPTRTVSILRLAALISIAAVVVFCFAGSAIAHPLGNFTVNHFARIGVGGERVSVRFVIDMAEIPALQELQAISAGGTGSPSTPDLTAYAERVASQYADALLLTVDGAPVQLLTVSRNVSLPAGAGGLPTLRIECDFAGVVPAGKAAGARVLRFEDATYKDRIGWRELVVSPFPGVAVFDSSAFGSGVTDELKAYPADLLAAPLNERAVELRFIRGDVPSDARPLLWRDGRTAAQSRDRLAELIAVRDLTPGVAFVGLLLAILLGGLHALSPGHGKTVVGAYLVGSRGTARHAAFLGLTVTITHTAGVFALGLVTLLASGYVVPERIFPILSFVSGALVLGIGLSLFVRRLRGATASEPHLNAHADDNHSHTHPDVSHTHADLNHCEHQRDHSHANHNHTHDGVRDSSSTHSHAGQTHSHLPPGADGARITWRSLLALGISGGILPCPSALVVLLAAISLHRVGYGLLLVAAFSLGLAGVLTGVGLAFVYARRFVKSDGRLGGFTRALPIFSAFVITCAGAAICYESLGQAGFNLFEVLGRVASQLNAVAANSQPSIASTGAIGVLGLGLLFGIKHATEVDHIVAVSAIVSEHRKLSRAALVGGLWGAGHTASLVVVGSLVLALRIVIPQGVASWLEFGVALMIIGLGAGGVRKALRRRSDFHLHLHDHDELAHAHLHFHEQTAQPHSHAITRIGFKPTIIGAMHGLAGSAALTLLVLTQIDSAVLGLLYLFVFGAGSIVGMLLMSSLVGLPFALSAGKLKGIHYGLQMVAGACSIAFGIWYAIQTGFHTW